MTGDRRGALRVPMNITPVGRQVTAFAFDSLHVRLYAATAVVTGIRQPRYTNGSDQGCRGAQAFQQDFGTDLSAVWLRSTRLAALTPARHPDPAGHAQSASPPGTQTGGDTDGTGESRGAQGGHPDDPCARRAGDRNVVRDDRLQVVAELGDTDYGMREFIIRDPNGFWITFGQNGGGKLV